MVAVAETFSMRPYMVAAIESRLELDARSNWSQIPANGFAVRRHRTPIRSVNFILVLWVGGLSIVAACPCFVFGCLGKRADLGTLKSGPFRL